MHATAAPSRRDRSSKTLARDMYTLFAYLLGASTPELFRALSELDLSLTQVKLLHVLDRPGADESLKALAEEMAFSLPAASRAIDALAQRGLVERREDEHDRRMKRVRITSHGQDVVRRLSQIRMALLEQFADTLAEEERRALLDALAPLVQREEVAAFRPRGLRS